MGCGILEDFCNLSACFLRTAAGTPSAFFLGVSNAFDATMRSVSRIFNNRLISFENLQQQSFDINLI